MKKYSNLHFFLHVLFFGVLVMASFNIYQNYQVKYQILPQTIATTNVNFQVNPGSISQAIEHDLSSPTEIQLSSVDISLAPPVGIDSVGELRTIARDHRCTAVGWTQTLSCSDLNNGANIITVDNLTVTPNLITPIGTSNPAGITLGGVHTFVDALDVIPLAIAPPGTGTGRFRVISDLLLHIDKSTIPGTYTGTMTLTIS